jgi:hypothetical protein
MTMRIFCGSAMGLRTSEAEGADVGQRPRRWVSRVISAFQAGIDYCFEAA